tara:strand:+ start:695 stop:892 length:198 start_codon:yes stop_codon:yes gene_type:complete
MTDKQWESQEIATWVVNDESLYRLARGSWSANHFLQQLENYGISEIGGITLTPENLRESFEDAND